MNPLSQWLKGLFGRGRGERHYERFMTLLTQEVASDENTALAFEEITKAVGMDEGDPIYRAQRVNLFLLRLPQFSRLGLRYTIESARADCETALRAAAARKDLSLSTRIRATLNEVEELGRDLKRSRPT